MAFDPFGDASTRGYLRNVAGETDRDRVTLLEHQSFAQHVVPALEYLAAQRILRYQDVLKTHEILFGSVYPWAGKDRAALAPQLAIGRAGYFDMFAHPADIQRAADYALDMARDVKMMRNKPGEIYGLLAHAHPVLEGNGRTITTVHADLTRRAGFHIDWPAIPKAEFLSVLTEELRKPGGALDCLLEPHIVSRPLQLIETATRLSNSPYINPQPSRSSSPGP